MNIQFDIVINTQFGGFSLTKEMVRRLRRRNVSWAPKDSSSDDYSYYVGDDYSIRRDPDLIAVVRELTSEFKAQEGGLPYREMDDLRRDLIGGLEVREVTVHIEIESYDGKERVLVEGMEA